MFLTHVGAIPFILGTKIWYLLYVTEFIAASIFCEILPWQTSASRATEEAKTINSPLILLYFLIDFGVNYSGFYSLGVISVWFIKL